MRQALTVFLAFAALALSGCATLSNTEKLAKVRKLGIVEPSPMEAYVRLGSPPSATPVAVPTSSVAAGPAIVGSLLGGLVIAGIEKLHSVKGQETAVRFREECPQVAERSETLRRETLARLVEALSGRFEAVVIRRDEYQTLAEASRAKGDLDAFLIFELDASLWASTALMDYWPALRGPVAIVRPDGQHVIRAQQVRAVNRAGISFPNSDEVVARCGEALAALDALAPLFATNVMAMLGTDLQEKQ